MKTLKWFLEAIKDDRVRVHLETAPEFAEFRSALADIVKSIEALPDDIERLIDDDVVEGLQERYHFLDSPRSFKDDGEPVTPPSEPDDLVGDIENWFSKETFKRLKKIAKAVPPQRGE